MDAFVSILSAEWLLKKRPNGGTAILLRSLWIALIIYFSVLALRNVIDPGRSWNASWQELRAQLVATIPWFGAIFAAAYAALYSRFASQWSYLAGFYNQIKATECKGECAVTPLAEWKAAFIEDAEELHLASKPVFASIIRVWGSDTEVAASFVKDAHGGAARLKNLLERVEKAWAQRG